ncbi:MAG: 50S ribosomal protein L29 [Patescibacteria group bacterium]
MAPKKKATAQVTGTTKSLVDLKALTKSELQTELTSARRDLYILTMKKELGELKQSHLMKQSRKYIAQISTFITSAV